MEGALEKIELLRKEGAPLKYDKSATLDEYGYSSAMSPQWVSWVARTQSTIGALFGSGSAASKLVKVADTTPLVGYGPENFFQAHSCYMGALDAAKQALENDTFDELLKSTRAVVQKDLTNKVFVVHGHNDAAKAELEILLREMGLEPVVLHRKPDGGKTIIEKFEEHADVGFAFILMTPDEVAYLASEEAKPDDKRKKEHRARPNVIFEFGYFVGRLGRNRTCCLYQGGVTLPSDLGGLLYKQFTKSIEEVAYSLRKELIAAGYSVA